MKTSKSLAIAISLMVAATSSYSCSEEYDSISSQKETTIIANYESQATKASFSSFGAFNWLKDDKIAVLSDENKFATFSLQAGAGTSEGSFTNESGATIGTTAIYPSDIAKSIVGNNVTVTLPATYEYVEGNVEAAMVANNVGGKFTFKHLGAVIRMNFDYIPSDATTFKIIADGKKITGDFTFDHTTAEPVISTSDATVGNSVTITGLSGKTSASISVPLPLGTYPSIVTEFLNASNEVIASSVKTYTDKTFARCDLLSNAFSITAKAELGNILVEWKHIDGLQSAGIFYSTSGSTSARYSYDSDGCWFLLQDMNSSTDYQIKVNFNSTDGKTVTSNTVKVNLSDAPDSYVSSDFSMDGKVIKLQSATKGAGIDVVLMGDGFTDKDIYSGNYDRTMKMATESLFSIEPYKTFRDLFNVYMVYAVSKKGTFQYGSASETSFSSFPLGKGYSQIYGKDSSVDTYARKATSKESYCAAVILNAGMHGGMCHYYYPGGGSFSPEPISGYISIVYIPFENDMSDFKHGIRHEVGGHGIGKLDDEYWYNDTKVFSDATSLDYYHAKNLYLNVDYHSDATAVWWSKFLTDSRYSTSGLGVFEGARYCGKGIYRPSETSIMRSTSEITFNAPSRFIIYKWLRYLAYGEDFSADNYEAFVTYDAINR